MGHGLKCCQCVAECLAVFKLRQCKQGTQTAHHSGAPNVSVALCSLAVDRGAGWVAVPRLRGECGVSCTAPRSWLHRSFWRLTARAR